MTTTNNDNTTRKNKQGFVPYFLQQSGEKKRGRAKGKRKNTPLPDGLESLPVILPCIFLNEGCEDNEEIDVEQMGENLEQIIETLDETDAACGEISDDVKDLLSKKQVFVGCGLPETDESISAFNAFKTHIQKYPLLTAEQELELSRIIHTDPEHRLEAWHALINSNLRLVITVAGKIRSHNTRGSILDMMDMVQEGCRGLMKAAARYNYVYKTRFSTCAVPWIFQKIIRAIDNQREGISIPANAGSSIRKSTDDIQRYLNGDDVTDLSPRRLKRIKELAPICAPMLTIDNSTDEDDKGVIAQDMIPASNVRDDSLILEKIEAEQYSEKFHDVLREILTEEEYEICCMRHGMGPYSDGAPCALKSIADAKGKSTETIRLVLSEAEGKIKQSRKARMLMREWNDQETKGKKKKRKKTDID